MRRPKPSPESEKRANVADADVQVKSNHTVGLYCLIVFFTLPLVGWMHERVFGLLRTLY